MAWGSVISHLVASDGTAETPWETLAPKERAHIQFLRADGNTSRVLVTAQTSVDSGVSAIDTEPAWQLEMQFGANRTLPIFVEGAFSFRVRIAEVGPGGSPANGTVFIRKDGGLAP